MRESIAGVDELIKMSADGDGTLGIDASNLILLLQGNIYPQYACNEIRGTISRTSISEIKQKVRTRILELTLELEKSAPSAASISLGAIQVDEAHIEQVERISQHIIYGNVTTINSGNGSNINLQIGERDSVGLIDYLVKSGIPEKDASELAEIMASEGPTCPDEPLGDNAKNWLADNLKKAAKGTWNIGITIATKVVSEAALKYYGLK